MGAFIESVQDIPEVQDSQLIELLGSVPGIDVGEQLLLASCIENPEAIFMTGDRRCLTAIVANQPALSVIHQRLLDAVVTFESSLLLCVHGTDQAQVYENLVSNPKPDGMLKLALSNAGAAMCECIFPILVSFTITLPSKIDFLIGSGEGKKLRANKALFYCVKNTAKNCT